MAIRDMIQTILQLKQLQFDEEKVELARRAQGLAETQAQHQVRQMEIAGRATQAQMLAGIQQRLQGVSDPTAFLKFKDELASAVGFSPELMETFITGTPTARQTTIDRVTAQAATDPRMAMIGGVNNLTGQTLGGIANEADELSVPASERMQAARIRLGTRLNAAQDASNQVAWAGQRLGERTLAHEAAKTAAYLDIQRAEANAALMKAQAQLNKQAFDDASELIAKRDVALQAFLRTGPTLTQEGVNQMAQNINLYNQQLRKISPTLFGNLSDIPAIDESAYKKMTATGTLEFWANKPR